MIASYLRHIVWTPYHQRFFEVLGALRDDTPLLEEGYQCLDAPGDLPAGSHYVPVFWLLTGDQIVYVRCTPREAA